MTRLESRSGNPAQAGFGILFPTAAALPSPIQALLGRPFDGDVPQLTPAGGSAPRRVFAAMRRWHERVRQRRQLLQLSDHMLRDLGITRAEALGEAEKPFWRG
jgi:uncharacterized protein YjiS (DUF1127 family)